jgi:hypothetical protein
VALLERSFAGLLAAPDDSETRAQITGEIGVQEK